MKTSNQFDQCSEEVLVAMASKSDLDAFNQLVLNYQDMVYHHAYALVGDPDIADDIAQESFIKAFRNISRFRGGSFRSWLLRIVTNTFYDLLRRFRVQREQPLSPMDANNDEMEPAWLADPKASVETIVERNEGEECIHQILDELPAKYRSVLTLIDLYEYEYKDVARILRVPVGTIKSRLARARLQMRRKVQGSSECSILLEQTVHNNPS